MIKPPSRKRKLMQMIRLFFRESGIWVVLIAILIIIGVILVKMPRAGYQEVRIPFGSTKQTLQAFVYSPKDNEKHDVVIFSHGAAGGNPKESLPAELQAKYFLNKGYIVIVPMRKGRGTSDGVSLESEEKNNDINSWIPGIDSALEDVSSTIEYCLKLPNFNKDIILAGSSRGGYLSIAYSARGKYKQRISAVINFAGGWVGQREDKCPVDFNLVSFKELGKLSNVPSIWLYGKNDFLYEDSSIQDYFNAYKQSNNNCEFLWYDNVPQTGHFVANYKDIWEKDLTQYLDKLKKDN